MKRIALLLFAITLAATSAEAEDWPQFRGPNGAARTSTEAPLPEAIGPETNVLWKIELPPGHSSPVLVGERIYVTCVRDGRLLTMALARATGEKLWEAEAPQQALEPVHAVGNQAQSTPAADRDVVVSFFGSCGLFAYDTAGNRLWHVPMDPFKNDFGAGSSPILVDDWVILCQDHDTDSFLMALDKRTGDVVWKTSREEFPRNYATPVIWDNNGRRQIVVAATLRIVGYDLETGREAWTVRGVARIVNMSPTVGPDGVLYVACWSPGADAEDRIQVDPFEKLIHEVDANANGAIEEPETPDGPLKQRFTQIDRDKSGQISEAEYESMRRVFETAKNVMVAIRPGGEGDITDTHVAWNYGRMLPYVPSPVYVDGYLYMVKNGGIVACLAAVDGKPGKQGRISGTANYYASPVAGDGKIYLLSERGEATVITANPRWKELSTGNFGEDIFATPAIADGRIYIRTSAHLYCLGLGAPVERSTSGDGR